MRNTTNCADIITGDSKCTMSLLRCPLACNKLTPSGTNLEQTKFAFASPWPLLQARASAAEASQVWQQAAALGRVALSTDHLLSRLMQNDT